MFTNTLDSLSRDVLGHIKAQGKRAVTVDELSVVFTVPMGAMEQAFDMLDSLGYVRWIPCLYAVAIN